MNDPPKIRTSRSSVQHVHFNSHHPMPDVTCGMLCMAHKTRNRSPLCTATSSSFFTPCPRLKNGLDIVFHIEGRCNIQCSTKKVTPVTSPISYGCRAIECRRPAKRVPRRVTSRRSLRSDMKSAVLVRRENMTCRQFGALAIIDATIRVDE